jgi:hypothetical protein
MSIHRPFLKQLAELNGTVWKEAEGEVHSQYNEAGFWILLYEDSDLQLVHERFCEIFKSYIIKMAPLQMDLSYFLYVGTESYCVDHLKGNEAVLLAIENNELGKNGFPISDGNIIGFRYKDSKRDI